MGARSGRQRRESTATLIGALLLLTLWSAPSPKPDPVLAHRLYRAALDQAALLREDSALALYRAARQADPTYLPAHVAVMQLMQARHAERELPREYGDPDSTRDPFARCLAVMARALARRTRPVPDLLALERNGGATHCSTIFLVGVVGGLGAGTGDSLMIGNGPRAIGYAPEIQGLYQGYSGALTRAGQWNSADSVLAAAERADMPAQTLLELHLDRAALARARGDTARAMRMEKEAAAMAARDGRPLLRIRVVGLCCPGHLIADADERLSIARSAGSWVLEWEYSQQLSHNLLDQGQPARALSYQNREVTIADSIGIAGLKLVSYTRRGHTYLSLGNPRKAEADLLRAIDVATPDADPYFAADAWHFLAHAYEADGRWVEADRAVERFIALTRTLRLDAQRMESHHDAGTIRWKAGWHAAARSAFEAMVRVIDEEDNNHYWAGEYLERSGQLARALPYYRRGAAIPGGQQGLNLAGLSRVYEQIGLPDSAEAAARRHDAIPASWTPLELPLLPHLLARQGRRDEAVRLARQWAERQQTNGNVEGATRATLEVGELLLGGALPEAARLEAVRAESLARSLNFTDELIHARRLEGLALARLGQPAAALELLRGTAAMAARHPTANAVFETELALGDVLAGAGHDAEALVAYDHAARTVELVTGGLEEDLARSGYRDRHLLPFDGALRVLLGHPRDEAQLAAMLAWAERRAGAALALSTGVSQHDGQPATMSGVRRGLDTRQALLNFLVVDSSVAVIIVTRQVAALVQLPIRLARLEALVGRIRQPLSRTYAGRIDLSRAEFDASAAHELYSALLAPVDTLLSGRDRLAIVPDGPLQYLPFEALVTDGREPSGGQRVADGNPGYLVDRFEILYLPSAAVLARRYGAPAWRADSGTRILAVEHAVAGGTEEIAAINGAWPEGRVTTLEGGEATETAVRRAGARLQILHLAAHAIADDRDPLASHLRLAADDTNDGFLHVNEIAADHFAGHLVVLSGCETLVGPDYRGEGLMGLARAFLVGGSSAVLASQWPVGASSAELMGTFYRHLAAGDPPATALRAAQLGLRRDLATAHPFYWASFVLVEGK